MSSNIDGFGAPAGVEEDMAFLETGTQGPATAQNPEQPVSMAAHDKTRPPSFFEKRGPGGLPMGAIVGIGLFFLLIVAFVIAIALKGKSNSANATQASPSQTEMNVVISEITEMGSRIQQALNAAQSVGSELNSYKLLVDKRFTDLQQPQQRVNEAELTQAFQLISQLQQEVKLLEKKLQGTRPLKDAMKINAAGKVLSIGGGKARVLLENGSEIDLVAGDPFGATKVTAVRSDLGRVILANGSVLE